MVNELVFVQVGYSLESSSPVKLPNLYNEIRRHQIVVLSSQK